MPPFSALSYVLKLTCLSFSNSSIQASFQRIMRSMASVCTSWYSLELSVLASSIPSQGRTLGSGEVNPLTNRVILRLTSAALRQANSRAAERAALNLNVTVTRRCSWGAREKESGENANFQVLQRQKKRLEMGEAVLLTTLRLCVPSRPSSTTSGSMVTTSDRILLLNLNDYYKSFKSPNRGHPRPHELHPIFDNSFVMSASVGQGGRRIIMQFEMSRQLSHLRESRGQPVNLRDFTNSVDIKRFSRQRGNMTPMQQAGGYFKKLCDRSNQKIRQTQPTSLAVSFSKHISHKNMETKRKLSSGYPAKAHHHSVSLDRHLLKEKYAAAKELFDAGKYERLVAVARHIMRHFEYSNAQKNLYYWLAVSLMQLRKYQEAVEEMSECLSVYSNFQEGFLCLAAAYQRLHRYRLATENYQRAITLNPKLAAPYLHLAHCYLASGDHTKAIDFCRDALGKFPNEAELLMVLVESALALGRLGEAESAVRAAEQGFNRRDSLVLYIRGLVQKSRGNEGEAYILFQQSLKYNNNRLGVSRSLLQTIKLQIQMRDFYKAHHSIGRSKFLELQQTQEMRIYSVFIEGVMTMMKKKSEEALKILAQLTPFAKRCEQMHLTPLLNKYIAYGYFKLSDYAKAIIYYHKIRTADMDQSSTYNQLLAEGIQLADRSHKFPQAIAKFNQAKTVYPQKVEPYVYIAMTLVLRSNEGNKEGGEAENRLAEALIEALKQLQAGNKLNPNSSNLLYHRTIIHLYFQDWQQAHSDINRCIEKAQQNLPKYFYLRGVCHTCIRDFKKAINEFSICLSLDSAYADAYLEKAKCYFLLGNTEKGFAALKQFMELSPDDLSIYRWIGDLLYQGMSYSDALKAYAQLGQNDELETQVMKLKCTFRVGSLGDVSAQLKIVEKHPLASKEKVAVDGTALALLSQLVRQEYKNLNSLVKKINKSLEGNVVGYLFQLVDCMNLLGLASFYSQRYADAYESFLLVLELYQSLEEKQTFSLKSEICDEEKNLRVEDIYANIIACQFAQGNHTEAMRMTAEELLSITSNPKRTQALEGLMQKWAGEQAASFDWEFKTDRPFNSRLPKVELVHPRLTLRTKLSFNLYHDSAAHLYTSSVAEKLVARLHAGFIDNMPEGPWIRRNPYGVVFTEEVMPTDNSISFQDTPRIQSSRGESQQASSCSQVKTISKREEFLKKLRFDEGVEAKLNNMIQKAQEGNKQKE